MKAKGNYKIWRLSNILSTGRLIYYSKRIVFFDDIDEMPVYNWNKYRDTGNGKYLAKEVLKASNFKIVIMSLYHGLKLLIKPKTFNKDLYKNVWDKLYQQYIDKFGYDDSFLEILKLKEERFDKQSEWMSLESEKRKKFVITEIKILGLQIEEIEKSIPKNEKTEFEKIKVWVDKWLNAVLDDRVTSVVQYQYYINEMSKPQKTS